MRRSVLACVVLSCLVSCEGDADRRRPNGKDDAGLDGGGQSGGRRGSGGQPGSGGALTGSGGAATGGNAGGGVDASVEPDASVADASPPIDTGAPDPGDGSTGVIIPSCLPGLSGSRIELRIHPDDPERVYSLRWLASDGNYTANLVGEGGPSACGDPREFFGQSYGAPEGTAPYPVVQGHRATIATCGTPTTIVSAPENCTQVAGDPHVPVTTSYQFFPGTEASKLKVTRTIEFGAESPAYAADALRVFVPRVRVGAFPSVIYPNSAGTAITVTSAASCETDCVITPGDSFSGAWFADVNTATGLAMIVVRDPASTGFAHLAVNYDSFSQSNLTSFVVVKPERWSAPVVEVEFLCFADLTSWPQTERDAAELPEFCRPLPPA